MLRITAIDHIVLTVANISAACTFYKRALGLEIIEFDNGRKALRAGRQKINLHAEGREFSPHALRPTSGSADLCLITQEPLAEWLRHFQTLGIDLVDGPIPQTGALGRMESIYVRDLDGNLIEVASYLSQEST